MTAQVEVARLEPMPRADNRASSGDQADVAQHDELLLEGTRWRLAERHDVSRVPGFSHVRRLLLQSSAFDWNQPSETSRALAGREEGQISGAYALGFHDEAGTNPGRPVLWLVFLDDGLRVSRAASGRWASMRPAMPGLQRFFAAQFDSTRRTDDEVSAPR